MSSLKYQQKSLLEDLLQMSGGHVLDFSKRTFTEFFRDFGVNILDDKYVTYGKSDSKANCLRAFWELEPNELVSQVLHALLDLIENSNKSYDIKDMETARQFANDLNNPSPINQSCFNNQDSIIKFLETDFIATNIVNPSMTVVLNRRLNEISACQEAGAFLATVIMTGSFLEGLLLELANNNSKKFNQSQSSPKYREGKVKEFNKWTLEELINVACDTKLISVDVKKFSSSLRDFRNYIHPHEQMKSQFHPDKHTVAMAIRTLRAAIADISNERMATKLSAN